MSQQLKKRPELGHLFRGPTPPLARFGGNPGAGGALAHFGLWLRLAREDAKGSGPPNWISLELLAVKMAAHEASTGDGITGRGSLKEKTAVCYPQQLRLLCLDNGPSHGQRFFGVPEEGTSF